jgi:hypothetical protein
MIFLQLTVVLVHIMMGDRVSGVVSECADVPDAQITKYRYFTK